MPYITKEARKRLNVYHKTSNFEIAETAGELNYKITQLVDEYINAYGLDYTNVNTVIGALECAKLELYRRVAAPYEDKKCAENGDVYTCIPLPKLKTDRQLHGMFILQNRHQDSGWETLENERFNEEYKAIARAEQLSLNAIIYGMVRVIQGEEVVITFSAGGGLYTG